MQYDKHLLTYLLTYKGSTRRSVTLIIKSTFRSVVKFVLEGCVSVNLTCHVNTAQSNTLVPFYSKQMSEIRCTNIHAFLRYRNFRVGIFYLDSVCASLTVTVHIISPKHLTNKKLSYRKQIAHQLRTQYVDSIYSNSDTLKSCLCVTQGNWKCHHLIYRI